MSEANYEKLVNIISKSSGLDKEEIEKRVHAKREKISGLISKEGAAQIIAAELGIVFDNAKMKINDLLPGMKKVNTVGKVINLFPVRNFVRNGQESKVANMVIADETGNIRVVLWDLNHISFVENGKVSQGSVVEVFNATMRENELHLGSFSEFKESNEQIGEVKTERIVREKNISDFKNSDNASARAFVVQVFAPRFFDVCVQCKKKAVNSGDGFVCEQHGKTTNERRALMNVVLDDGTATMRAVLFGEQIRNLGFSNLESPEMIENEKKNVLGKEMFFSGNVRTNKFFNNLEFIINEAKEIDVDKLIENLEKY